MLTCKFRGLFTSRKTCKFANILTKSWELNDVFTRLRAISYTSCMKKAKHFNYELNDCDEDIAIDELKLKLGNHNVFVLQPDILGDARPSTMSNTTCRLQLDESLALVDCLPGWKICGNLILTTRSPNDNRIFKGERLKKLVQYVSERPETTAIFVSANRLHGLQRKHLMEHTRIENIFDRYMLVLEIFRLRAQTRQAKLQVALAEIPYLRMNLRSEMRSYNRQGGGDASSMSAERCGMGYDHSVFAVSTPRLCKTVDVQMPRAQRGNAIPGFEIESLVSRTFRGSIFVSTYVVMLILFLYRFNAVGGPGETPFELAMRQFRFREQKIKQRLTSLQKKRDEQRIARKKTQLPVVAVVGYTNAGKTTLIKALSKSEKIQPKNHLFATLDVTSHPAISSGNMKYFLIDTVGFLSNLPHTLIDAFTATMKDMLQADIIVHVRDVSHPDHKNQKTNVYKVLSDLNLPENLLKNMIEVRNKIDLVDDLKTIDKEEETCHKSYTKLQHKSKPPVQASVVCTVSATHGIGLDHLNEKLHERLVNSTGCQNLRIKVPASGDHLDWFKQYATVIDFETEGDYHFVVEVTITEPMLNKFKSHYFDFRIL